MSDTPIEQPAPPEKKKRGKSVLGLKKRAKCSADLLCDPRIESFTDTPQKSGACNAGKDTETRKREHSGMVKASDPFKIRVAGMNALSPPELVDKDFHEQIKGLSVPQALAAIKQRDIQDGTFLAIWERYRQTARNGSGDTIKDYLDRVTGKAAQTIVSATHVKIGLDPEAKKLIDGLKAAFGMETVDTTAREVA